MSHSLGNVLPENQHVVRGSEVFVGGLARTVTEDKITEIFSTCGEILEIRMIKDHNGSLKGFCFVRFSTKAAADKAVKEKCGLLLDGKKIGVLPSVEQDTLFLGNLYKGWSAEEFNILVRQVFPDVVSVDLVMPSSIGETPGQKKQNRGFAFVKFSSHAAASRAHRAGSSPEFILGGKLHPAVDWAEEDPEIDPEELAKIKIAFVRNLPPEADENFLMELFMPLGKVDKVVFSKKTRTPVGFVHFANRSELDNAIKVMNGKTVQGPNRGPPFKLQVEVARPMDKNKKRAREDPHSKQSSSHSKLVKADSAGLKVTAQQIQEPVAADPYEAAVVLLPVAVKERLLRILRLGIATRFDIDIEWLTSLKELPESTAISVLDQFMLSGADKLNKGAYLSGLISRYQTDKLGLYGLPSRLSRAGDFSTKEPEPSSFTSRANIPAFDSVPSHLGLTTRSDGLASRYSSIYSDYYLPSRASFGRIQDTSSAHLLQTRNSTLSEKAEQVSFLPAVADRRPAHVLHTPSSTLSGRAEQVSYLPVVADHRSAHVLQTPRSTLSGKAEHVSYLPHVADRRPARPQIRFDPFTGEPYKFDPFTGEPIRPESPPHHFRSPY